MAWPGCTLAPDTELFRQPVMFMFCAEFGTGCVRCVEHVTLLSLCCHVCRVCCVVQWVLLCRGLTVAHKRAAMCYLLSNTTRSTSHPAPAELVGWSSSWLKAEGSLVGVLGGLLGSAPIEAVQEGLQAVLSALARLVQRSCNDHLTKGFLSKLRVRHV